MQFILPNFYNYGKLNRALFSMEKDSEKISCKNFIILGEEGSLPFSPWNGNTHCNFGFSDFYEISSLSMRMKPLIFDCSNLNIKDVDLLNTRENLIIKANHIGSNYIIVSDYAVYLYLKNLYPYYKFIASEFFIFPDGVDKEEVLKSFEFFKVTSEEKIALYPKNKILYVLPTSLCDICSQYQECVEKEQKAIYNYNNYSVFRNCVKNQIDLNRTVEIFEHIISTYHINSFCFDVKGLSVADMRQVISLYLMMFIKDEHHLRVKNIFEEAIRND